MSTSDKEIYNVGSSGGGIHAREEDNGGGGGGGGGKKQREDGYGSGSGRGRGRCGRTGDFAKARQVILCVLTKAEKRLLTRRNRKTSFSGGSPAAAANRRTSGKKFDSVGRRAKGSCSCFTQPQTLESPSHTSDPNDPNFTYEMLKAFVEKNDFYSKECNTHLNFDVASHAS